jgi:tRNA modification GTPase
MVDVPEKKHEGSPRAEGGDGLTPQTGGRGADPWVEDTIVAVSTAQGTGAIGIVRLSGPDALSIAEAAFRLAAGKRLGSDESYTLHYGHVVDPRTSEVIDEALLAVMRKPRSYTCEDVAEIHCHGGSAAQRAVLRLLVSLGARPAKPGEFTRRAFLNGRIDLAQAESVAAIVAARSTGALRLSLRQLDGGLSQRLRDARRELVGLLALVEATVDFADEDVDAVDWVRLAEDLSVVHMGLLRLTETAFIGRALQEGVRTAIVGKPNAGKSSLLNALLMRERAIVSEIPGTTRDTVEELMEIGGIPIHLVDTAGIRAGGDHVERLGVERSVKAMELADLVLAVFDLTGPRDGAERELLGGADAERWVIVGNKRDLVEDEAEALTRLSAHLQGAAVIGGGQPCEATARMRVCSVSALTGEGVDDLRSTIQDIITGGGGLHLEEPILAGERQRALVDQAVQSAAAAMGKVARGEGEELVCEDIRMAAEALGSITGENLTPDLLEEVFSRFCLGK